MESLDIATLLGESTVPAMCYGILFTITWNCSHQILQSTRPVPTWIPFYLGAQFILSTTSLSIYSFYVTAETFGSSCNDDSPGPWVVLVHMARHPPYVTATVCALALSWISDGLLLHRVCSLHQFNIWISFLPGVLWLLTVGSGAGFVVLGVINHDPVLSKRIGVLHWSLATVFSLVSTGIIVIRLIRARARVSPAPIAAQYSSVIALTVESSALYTLFVLVFLIGYAQGSILRLYLFPAVVLVHGISALLILQRIIFNLTVGVDGPPTPPPRQNSGSQIRFSTYQTRSLDSHIASPIHDLPMDEILK
ncbi:hypothetical protein DL96DRAFT_1705921 [Flagelloscypha sp. PMI_526]|nr:hypothetical protein DL96DRAFT_1705921 [Flagelloscypha sp. PMI_526]